MKALYIYNLYPRLYRTIKDWINALDHIQKMGFNSIYINPIHYPGYSGSLYSVKEYYRLNDMMFSSEDGTPEEQIKLFLSKAKEKGIDVFMDLVINHTAFDSPLTKEHKDWYILENGDIKKPGAWENGTFVEWGDLAQFNLEGSSDRDNLWKYLQDMCEYFIEMGFSGFRCDAAYQIPNVFWSFLISNLKAKHSEIVFLAETLGCTPVQIEALSNCGFDYIFNSSKWWNFNDPWCLEQYEMSRKFSPSVSFPSGHDTDRLYIECNKNINHFLQRIYFSALFSKGFMITTGIEYAFTKRINTVSTNPNDWENTGMDFSENIRRVLEVKKAFLPLHEESPISIVDQANWQNVFCFCKDWCGQKVLIVINKSIDSTQHVSLENVEAILSRGNIKDYSPEERLDGNIVKLDIDLKPGEIKIFGSADDYGKA